MDLQDVRNVFDLQWAPGITMRDVIHQDEAEQSAYNFELADVAMLFRHFDEYEQEFNKLIEAGLAATRLRDGDEVLTSLQFARCAWCHFGHRTRGLHCARGPWRVGWHRPTMIRVNDWAFRCCRTKTARPSEAVQA